MHVSLSLGKGQHCRPRRFHDAATISEDYPVLGRSSGHNGMDSVSTYSFSQRGLGYGELPDILRATGLRLDANFP